MTERAQIDAETLMAYADGELSPIEAKRVERAIADDPALKRQVDDHRRLRAMLANGFAPVMDQPVPDRLSALLQPPVVTDIARARAARQPATIWRHWGTGIAVAASLAIGIMVGQGFDAGRVRMDGGAMIASGGLAHALDTQLASAGQEGSIRMIATFRDRQGTICRSFSGEALSGIACRADNGWQLRETRGGVAASENQYRQAGSANAALMADAQAMMAGDPFDADAEMRARSRDWR